LLFLIRQRTNITKQCKFYDFMPYKYGPYSFSVERDLRKLTESGFIKMDENITLYNDDKNDIKIFPKGIGDEIGHIITQYQKYSDNQLINEVYRKYPDYTVLSERNPIKNERFYAEPAIYTMDMKVSL